MCLNLVILLSWYDPKIHNQRYWNLYKNITFKIHIKIDEFCHLFSSISLFFRQIALRISLQRPLLANMFDFSCDKVLNGEPRLARALIGGSCRPLLSCLLPMKSNSGCNNNNVDYYYEGNENDRQKSEIIFFFRTAAVSSIFLLNIITKISGQDSLHLFQRKVR